MIEELRDSMKMLDEKFEELRGYFDLDKNVLKMEELEGELNQPEIWKNQEKADSLSRQLKALRSVIGPYNEVKDRHDAIKELSEIVESDDTESLESLMEESREVRKIIDKLEFKCLLGGEADRCDAILSVNSGAGGTESCDWASMLLRMYTRWAEDHGCTVEMIDRLAGEEAGIKSATLLIKGNLVFGYLKAETGVHRLVRISPFDSNKRRHTSFASIDVIPDIDKNIKVDINESDLKIDTYRASGAGGQHVNVTDSAVRITHMPTGIVVQCQNERSQHKNKAIAMKILRGRIYEKKRKEQEDDLMKSYGDKKKIEWGSQIRSYVLHPYKMVKDHRTDEQSSNAEKVLDGDLDTFIEAFLKMMAKK
ncbi:MAG: peptide chain release factor 2 [Candidatus Tantalella remota]|nr:peptide chain release factor 2 [Candidatus Tantalella remota]